MVTHPLTNRYDRRPALIAKFTMRGHRTQSYTNSNIRATDLRPPSVNGTLERLGQTALHSEPAAPPDIHPGLGLARLLGLCYALQTKWKRDWWSIHQPRFLFATYGRGRLASGESCLCRFFCATRPRSRFPRNHSDKRMLLYLQSVI